MIMKNAISLIACPIFEEELKSTIKFEQWAKEQCEARIDNLKDATSVDIRNALANDDTINQYLNDYDKDKCAGWATVDKGFEELTRRLKKTDSRVVA